ncbi:nucleotidyltransferase domain-containing protein [Pelistega europaea]|uniref:Nucleotidyltransferase domain-containing protein n=1 Tax=Pelistega europaea TaxID=106147 RepID=A0A7Y4L8F2_9BURK|nr:nucleotidyltransferase domain-containing protein [Pelistega europaea]NOL48843.1 nucleotidyltransferase domain-containing protein [Pelistega europaea]
MDSFSEKIAREFVENIRGKFNIHDVIVYGSRARGDFRPDSDLDIAVILNDETDPRRTKMLAITDIGTDLLLKHFILVSPFTVLRHEWENPRTLQQKWFIDNVKKDGVSVWMH